MSVEENLMLRAVFMQINNRTELIWKLNNGEQE
jgi:hypothetical protein